MLSCTSINKVIKIMTQQYLIDYLRRRINPEYAGTLGTESYERRMCVEALEAQADELNRLRDSANNVISAFEALGRAKNAPAMLKARARCEQMIVALKNTLRS